MCRKFRVESTVERGPTLIGEGGIVRDQTGKENAEEDPFTVSEGLGSQKETRTRVLIIDDTRN